MQQKVVDNRRGTKCSSFRAHQAGCRLTGPAVSRSCYGPRTAHALPPRNTHAQLERTCGMNVPNFRFCLQSKTHLWTNITNSQDEKLKQLVQEHGVS